MINVIQYIVLVIAVVVSSFLGSFLAIVATRKPGRPARHSSKQVAGNDATQVMGVIR